MTIIKIELTASGAHITIEENSHDHENTRGADAPAGDQEADRGNIHFKVRHYATGNDGFVYCADTYSNQPPFFDPANPVASGWRHNPEDEDRRIQVTEARPTRDRDTFHGLTQNQMPPGWEITAAGNARFRPRESRARPGKGAARFAAQPLVKRQGSKSGAGKKGVAGRRQRSSS